MTISITPAWETKRTTETRKVEDILKPHFSQADSYRYNSATIRVRVIDPQFDGMPREKRDEMVEQYLNTLPAAIQQDIVTLLTFAPSELQGAPTSYRERMLNAEFEDAGPPML